MPILFASSCAVAPIQSARIKSNLSLTSRISFSDAAYKFNYEHLDTAYPYKGQVTIHPVNMLEDDEAHAFSLLPYPSWGIMNRIELSGYLVPGPPSFLFTAGGGIKVNIFDFKGQKKLFRDLALAVTAVGNSMSMEWENINSIHGGLIVGTYHALKVSELELVFISSATKVSVTSYSGTDSEKSVLQYAVDLGLGVLFWPTAHTNRINICGGFFYRIPVSEHIHCESEYYKTSVEKKVSPWIFQTALTVNLVMP